MPPFPGEERLLTVFADIHCYFAEPTPKPLNHRFDKGCYLYIYYDASTRKARIEVANNPGTPDQDSFHGALDCVHLRHSTVFPTLCTLTVGELQNGQNNAQASNVDDYEWCLPSANRDLLRLHTLDIYFWTLDDATQFLNSLETILSPAQVATDRHTVETPSESTLSPLVQQLEQVAITDPAYQNGQTRNPQSQLAQSTSQCFPPSASSSLSPPSSVHGHTESSPPIKSLPVELPADEIKEPANFTPMAYNPAAPAAPEPTKHREKTPPPSDAADGTGLATAVAADHGLPYTPPAHVYANMTTGYASPPPSAGLSHNPSFIPQPAGQPTSYFPSYSVPSVYPGPNGHVNQAMPGATPMPMAMSFAAPPQDPNPNAHFLYSQYQHAHLQQQQQFFASPPNAAHEDHHSSPPPGGYSNYSYDQPGRHPSFSGDHDMHAQVYRPTEAEAKSHYQKHAKAAMKNPGQRPHKIEDKVSRVESRVNSFLKRLDKSI